MHKAKFEIRNKIPEMKYIFTLNGVELPVLDITHPYFTAWTNDNRLKKLLPYVERNAEKNAEKFNKIPLFVKRFLAKRSFAMAELLDVGGENTFASGITTLMMKLGPDLIGRGKYRFWDRQVNKSFGALLIRMRVRDISKCEADALIPLLVKHPGKNLCFINIAGGAASDNINSLLLILKENPDLLKGRKIEVNVLDIDTFGPSFAENSIAALKEPGGPFNGLDISIRHIVYDWNKTDLLSDLLAARKGWIQICSSEGGLFEYCTDEVIILNLNALYYNSDDEIVIAGTLLHDIKTIDAGMLAALKISTGLKPRLLGLDGLKNLTEPNNWKTDKLVEGNPRYLVFSLSKILNS